MAKEEKKEEKQETGQELQQPGVCRVPAHVLCMQLVTHAGKPYSAAIVQTAHRGQATAPAMHIAGAHRWAQAPPCCAIVR